MRLENDVPNGIPYLPGARNAGRHKMEVRQQSLFSVLQSDDLRDLRDVSSNRNAASCSILVLTRMQQIVDAYRGCAYALIVLLLSSSTSQCTLDRHGLTHIDTRREGQAEETRLQVPIRPDLVFAAGRPHGREEVK